MNLYLLISHDELKQILKTEVDWDVINQDREIITSLSSNGTWKLIFTSGEQFISFYKTYLDGEIRK